MTTTRPRLSVCLPCTPNWVEYVRRTAASFSCQTVDPGLVEICVGVDGDPVPVEAVLQGLPVNVVVAGVSGVHNKLRRNHARNAAWRAASGELCWMLDGDFIVPPHTVEHLLEEYDASLARGLPAVFSVCMKGIVARPEGWLEASKEFAEMPSTRRLKLLLKGVETRDDVYSGYADSWASGPPRSVPRPDLLEGMPCVPRSVIQALGGFSEEFVGWGGNKEEFVDRLKVLGIEGLVDVRLLCSVMALHQPHYRTDNRGKHKQANHRLRARRLSQIRKGVGWWELQKEAVRKAMKSKVESASSKGGIHVIINTCERPHMLLSLLRDVQSCIKTCDLPVSVSVFDDASTADYSAVKKIILKNGWSWTSSEIRHGKREFWRWINYVLEAQRTELADFWIWLPDDERLCLDFFSRAVAKFNSITDRKKVALGFFADETRHNLPGWTGVTPHLANGAMYTGWVDGNFISNRRFLEALDFRIDRVNPKRWDHRPTLSSGVWAQVSERLFKKRLSMYHVEESMVVHVTGTSIMNPIERSKNPMRTRRFVDGHDKAQALSRNGAAWASMASVPRREKSLERTIKTLLPQVDRLNVFLNGYEEVPSFLEDDRIVVERSQDHSDQGDAGKVFWAEEAAKIGVWHFLCDDDMIYPSDYVTSMVEQAEVRERKAVVGAHGRVIKTSPDSYYKDSSLAAHFGAKVPKPLPVNVLGTGCLCYHTSTIQVDPARFSTPNMADVFFAVAAKEQGVPLIVIPHPANWIKNGARGDKKSIYEKSKGDDVEQSRLVRTASPWDTLPDVVSIPAESARKKPSMHRRPVLPKSARTKVSNTKETIAEAVHKYASKVGRTAGKGSVAVIGSYAQAALASMKGTFILADFKKFVASGADSKAHVITCGLLDGMDRAAQESALAVLAKTLRRGSLIVMAEHTALDGSAKIPPLVIQRALPGIGVRGTRLGWGGSRTIFYGRLAR